MTRIAFAVIGQPVAQGSKRAIVQGGKARLIEMGKGHSAWRGQVANAAYDAAVELAEPLDGPIKLTCEFRFPMPASRPKHLQRTGFAWKSTAPDVDKLIRSIGDAVTASGLIRDDARIALVECWKIETVEWTGVRVAVETIPHHALPLSLDPVA